MHFRRKSRCFRILLVSLALWIALPGHVIAQTIDEVKARQEELRKENEELEEKIDALREDEAKALEYRDALEQKIEVIEKKIDAARESIRVYDRDITALEKKLSLSRQKYQDALDLFAQRIRALYISGKVSTLEILLNSNSFSEFTARSEMMECVTRHDQQLTERIEEYLIETRDDREKVRGMRREAADLKKELESDQDELEELYAENSALIAELEEKQGVAQAAIAANEDEDAALEAELEELIRKKNEEEERRKQEMESQGVPYIPMIPGMHEGFSLCWPLPGVGLGNISGHFGEMYSNGPHNGLDIAASYGTEIVAVQAGLVEYADFHWSWGNNVLIWHNSTFSTRYAHMSSIAVSSGQYVEQGQVIGYVGSTGYSFGNHLHFEVYYCGSRVDPDPYLGI